MGTMRTQKSCETCRLSKSCVYRGIINPCDDWLPTTKFSNLRNKAKELVGKPMSFKEGQFVESATTLEFFTPKQASWLRSIYKRLMAA